MAKKFLTYYVAFDVDGKFIDDYEMGVSKPRGYKYCIEIRIPMPADEPVFNAKVEFKE